jgi:hypothetical protein
MNGAVACHTCPLLNLIGNLSNIKFLYLGEATPWIIMVCVTMEIESLFFTLNVYERQKKNIKPRFELRGWVINFMTT